MSNLPSTSRSCDGCISGEKPPLLQPSIPGTATKPLFSVGDVVLVRTDAFDKDGNLVEHVVEGFVRQVFPKNNVPFVTIKGKDYYNAIEVVEETFDGQEKLIRWSSEGGCDAIPDSEYGRVRKVFPGFENSRGLTEDEKRSMNILRSHVRMRNLPHPGNSLQSAADKVLLDEQGLCYILKKVSQKADPNILISHVTSQDKTSLTYLSYLLARVMAGELGASVEKSLSPQDIRSRGQLILEALESEDDLQPLRRLQTLDCPLLSVFMLTLMTSAYRGDEKGMFRSTFQKKNETKLNSLVSRIEMIMSILADTIYGRKSNKHLVGSAVKGIVMGCKLMVQNDSGVTDAVLAQLHKQGCVCSPRTIRRAIDDTVAAIPEGTEVRRNVPDGFVPVCVHTADNSDKKLLRKMVNSIVMANIQITTLPLSLWCRVSNAFRPGFPHFFAGLGTEIMPNENDDKRVRDVLHGQNVQALLLAVGSLRSDEKGYEQRLDPHRFGTAGVEDGGGRHRIPAATTMHTALLDNVSSKKRADVTRTVIQKAEEVTPHFMSFLQPCCMDQEIIENLYRFFFLSIAASTGAACMHTIGAMKFGILLSAMPLIIVLGNGHAIKNLVSSMFTFHRQWLYERVLIHLGTCPGTASYHKMERCSYIRLGTQTMVTINESLRISLAKRYLANYGNEKRINVPCREERLSPLELIGKYLVQTTGKGKLPHGHYTQVVLDPLKRPRSLIMLPNMEQLSDDFILFARSLEKDPIGGADWFGPSGYMTLKGSPYQSSEESLFESLHIDEQYAFVFSLPFRTKHGRIGLVEQCKVARIYDLTSEHSKEVLSNRLYEYLKAGGGNAGIEAARISNSRRLRYQRNTVPRTVNLQAKQMNSILFGAEGMALILCILVSRVQEPDQQCMYDAVETPLRCPHCHKSDRCSCSSHHLHVVAMKVLVQSTFMRWQPHYQTLAVYASIYATLILHHSSAVCKRVVLMIMRKTFAVSPSGDSWNCDSAEMVQETTSVKKNKNCNSKRPSNIKAGHKRLKLTSFIDLRRDEARERQDPPLGRSRPLTRMENDEETNRLEIAIRATTNIVSMICALNDMPRPNEFIVGSTKRMVNPKGIYYRQLNAWQRSFETSVAMVQGFQRGLVVKGPDYPFPFLRSLTAAPPKKKKRAKQTEDSVMSAILKIAQTTGQLAVTPCHDIFGPLQKAGTGKSRMMEEITREIENRSVAVGERDFGHLPLSPTAERHPIELFKHETSAHDWVHASKHLICLVDGLKDIQVRPTERPGGDATILSVIELARRILYRYTAMYAKSGNSLVVVFWDIEETSPKEREIQRSKRGKEQITINFVNAVTKRDFNSPLEGLGSWEWLKSHAKAEFMPFLAEAMKKAMVEPDAESNWSFSSLVPRDVAFAFIGGTKDSQMHVHFCERSASQAEVSSEVFLDGPTIIRMLANAANQGEAERMIFNFIASCLDRCIQSPDLHGAVTSCFDIRCEDTDALCGLGAFLVYRQSLRFQQANVLFHGRILLRLHRKSSQFARHLGQLVQRRDHTRVLGTALGELLVCYFDLIVLYHFFEKNDRLPDFNAPGHRAVSILSAIYTFINTDYAFSSISPAEMICGLKSDEFRCAAHRLVTLPGDDELGTIRKVRYSSKGMWLLFRAAMINRDKTRNIALQRYSPETLSTCLLANNLVAWLFFRGASIIAKENKPAPDELGFLAQLSICQVTLSRWADQTYEVAPNHSLESLANTCYDIATTDSEDWGVKWYPILDNSLRSKFILQGATDENMQAVLENQYENVRRDLDSLLRSALERACTNTINPGEPIVETIAIKEFKLKCIAMNVSELVSLLESAGSNYASRIHIYEETLCSCTSFKQIGYPKLRNSSIQKVSTGTHKSTLDRRPLEDWGDHALQKERTVGSLFDLMKNHATDEAAAKAADDLLSLVACHLLPSPEMSQQIEPNRSSALQEEEGEKPTEGDAHTVEDSACNESPEDTESNEDGIESDGSASSGALDIESVQFDDEPCDHYDISYESDDMEVDDN